MAIAFVAGTATALGAQAPLVRRSAEIPGLISKAAQTWLRVDGVDKISKEKEIVGAIRKGRKVSGLISDAFNLARAWR